MALDLPGSERAGAGTLSLRLSGRGHEDDHQWSPTPVASAGTPAGPCVDWAFYRARLIWTRSKLDAHQLIPLGYWGIKNFHLGWRRKDCKDCKDCKG